MLQTVGGRRMEQVTNRGKTLHQRFSDLDNTVFSAFCTSFDNVKWQIKPIEDIYSGVDVQATASTNSNRKTYDVEIKSRITVDNFDLVKDCFFQPDKWLSLVERENDNKIYFVIYPNCNKVAIWNITGELLRNTEKVIQPMKKNTARSSEQIEKQVYKLGLKNAKVYTFDLSKYREKYNALYKQTTKSH